MKTTSLLLAFFCLFEYGLASSASVESTQPDSTALAKDMIQNFFGLSDEAQIQTFSQDTFVQWVAREFSILCKGLGGGNAKECFGKMRNASLLNTSPEESDEERQKYRKKITDYCENIVVKHRDDPQGNIFDQLVACNILFNDISVPMRPTALLAPADKGDDNLKRLKDIMIRLHTNHCSSLVAGKLIELQSPSTRFDDKIFLDCSEEFLKIGPEFEKLGLITNFEGIKKEYYEKAAENYKIKPYIYLYDLTLATGQPSEPLRNKLSAICELLDGKLSEKQQSICEEWGITNLKI